MNFFFLFKGNIEVKMSKSLRNMTYYMLFPLILVQYLEGHSRISMSFFSLDEKKNHFSKNCYFHEIQIYYRGTKSLEVFFSSFSKKYGKITITFVLKLKNIYIF